MASWDGDRDPEAHVLFVVSRARAALDGGVPGSPALLPFVMVYLWVVGRGRGVGTSVGTVTAVLWAWGQPVICYPRQSCRAGKHQAARSQLAGAEEACMPCRVLFCCCL